MLTVDGIFIFYPFINKNSNFVPRSERKSSSNLKLKFVVLRGDAKKAGTKKVTPCSHLIDDALPLLSFHYAQRSVSNAASTEKIREMWRFLKCFIYSVNLCVKQSFWGGMGRTETIHRGHHHFPMKRTLFRLYPTRTDAFQLHSKGEQQGDKRCSLQIAFV